MSINFWWILLEFYILNSEKNNTMKVKINDNLEIDETGNKTGKIYLNRISKNFSTDELKSKIGDRHYIKNHFWKSTDLSLLRLF